MDQLIQEMEPLITKMDPFRRAQIIRLCDLCKTAHLQSHCERCDLSLCKVCVGEHLSSTSIRHKVVPYKYRKSLNYSQCADHNEELCKYYCEKCDIPVCSICVTSTKHKYHDISDILEKLDPKTESIQTDLEELETRIYPRYEEMAYDVQIEKAILETNCGKLNSAADQQGDILHREITAIVNQKKSDIQEMKTKHLSNLNKNTVEITQKITELKQIIAELKSILKSNDVSLTSTYKSRNSEFRILPPKVQVTLPSFSLQRNKDQLNEMFDSLSSLSIDTEHGSTIRSVKPLKSPEAVLSPPVKPMKSQEGVSSHRVKQLRDTPRITATINTDYTEMYSVSCLTEDQVWTRGNNEFMKLINFQENLMTSIQTKSGNIPGDLTVTRDGDLVYTDTNNRTVNLMKNKKIRTVITLQEWIPRYVCSTASGDLLVTMISEDESQSKLVRYSGFTEKQTIQFDDEGFPLYSSDPYSTKHVSENRNLDICVADNKARAVVVVNHLGELRFRYNGHPFNTDTSFNPIGITTDSQSNILTADYGNDRIHIIDQDGQFLNNIHNLRRPWDLCVDIRDNLFVAEHDTAKVKKIQYL